MLHMFLLICYPYISTSFHEILVPLIFLSIVTKGRTKNDNTGIHYARMRKNANTASALAQTAPRPIVSKPRDKQWCLSKIDLYLGVFDWKVQRFCWSKGTSLECAESIFVKTTETACVSECNELCRFKKKEGERQIVSLGDSRIKRVLDRLVTLSIPTVRVEALEYS